MGSIRHSKNDRVAENEKSSKKKRDFFHNSTSVKTNQADIQNFLYSLTFSTTFIFTPKFNGHVCYINPDVFF